MTESAVEQFNGTHDEDDGLVLGGVMVGWVEGRKNGNQTLAGSRRKAQFFFPLLVSPGLPVFSALSAPLAIHSREWQRNVGRDACGRAITHS